MHDPCKVSAIGCQKEEAVPHGTYMEELAWHVHVHLPFEVGMTIKTLAKVKEG